MIVIPEKELIFIHVPRTSGISISWTLAKEFNVQSYFGNNTHEGMSFVRENFHNLNYKTFGVIRNPLHIFLSYYKVCKTWIEKGVINNQNIHAQIHHRAYANMSFDEFVDVAIYFRTLCNFGGFYRKFFDSNSYIFQYEDNFTEQICSLLGKKIFFPKINTSNNYNIEVKEETKEKIRHFCYEDLIKFNYAI